MNLVGKKVLVVGAGASGVAASRLCLAQGATVVLTDMHPDPPAARGLDDEGVVLRLGGHSTGDFRGADVVVLSPGVDHRRAEVLAAAQSGAEVIGEMELAFRLLRTPAVMITGTNGKSTVTTLIGHILEADGRKVFCGGNLGQPLSDYAAGEQGADWAVLEVSSFQTDTAPGLRPKVGVILNITDDHLDRYDDFEQYAASKYRLLANQAQGDVAVLCADDPETAARMGLAPAAVWPYGLDCPAAPGGRLDGDKLVLSLPGGRMLRLGTAACALKGRFNLQNMLAACLAAAACGASAQAMQRGLDTYQPLHHRLALVAVKGGVAYYDDSKGTNVGAVQAAMDSLDMPIVLLLGGRDKQGRFGLLEPQLRAKARAVVCFGEAALPIAAQIDGMATCLTRPNLAQAVQAAAAMAERGDAVLLSPGCASFDAYTGYAARGDHFRRLVLERADG